MKRKRSTIFSIVLGASILLSGCQERTPLELSSNQLANEVQVTLLQSPIESAQARSTVDTTGVLNTEDSKYYATMYISGVKYDLGADRQIISHSKVIFSDKNESVEYRGKRIGFRGIDLGKVQVDGIEMAKGQKLIHLPDLPLPGGRDTAIGPQYILANRNGQGARDFNFSHNSRWEWRIGGNPPAIKPFNISVETPDELTIIFPRSTSVLLKNQDFHVQWTGTVKALRLIISGVKGSDFQPLLEIDVKNDGKDVIIPAKILGLLPTGTYQAFVFSFINSNEAKVRVNEFPDEIFVVSSSVHNLVLVVQ